LSQKKTENTVAGKWQLVGAPKNHDKFVMLMLKDEDIKEFEY
jgi:hypothetical protein